MAGLISWTPNVLINAVNRQIDTRMTRAGVAMVARARELVPVRTGKLRDSIGFIYRQSDRTVQLYADAPYALFIEFGTYRTHAQPFLRPAIAEASLVWGGSVEAGFGGAPAARSAPTPPRTSAHQAIVRHNQATTARYNRTRFGRARLHVGRS